MTRVMLVRLGIVAGFARRIFARSFSHFVCFLLLYIVVSPFSKETNVSNTSIRPLVPIIK